MCGIAGMAGLRGVSYGYVSRLLRRISHRGDPSFQGELAEGPGWVIGANRMAINSAELGAQPIWSVDRSVAIAFNGEIYDYARVSRVYGLGDWDLRTFGDGALLATAIAEKGVGIVSELAGMFAVVGIDIRNNLLFAARDRLGVKPLYYAMAGDCICFASEIKALAPEKDILKIEEFAPGSLVEICIKDITANYSLQPAKYFDVRQVRKDGHGNSAEDLQAALRRSVEYCCAYNGPVGVYLSGGVDSGGIYALMLQSRDDIIPIVAGHENSPDRLAASKLVAEIGKDIVIEVCPTENELFSTIERTIEVVESFEPNLVRQSAVQRCIAATAKQAGLRVILCGEGADELFCGYPEFYGSDTDWQKLRFNFLEDLHRTQLQRVDRCSMELTTEVRVPYLERDVLEVALTVRERKSFIGEKKDGRDNKVMLREALRGILPEWVRTRRKVVLSEGAGFSGNHPTIGLFAQLAGDAISEQDALSIRENFAEWRLRSNEEALYFSIFRRLGYDKASFMKKRVVANREHSLPTQ